MIRLIREINYIAVHTNYTNTCNSTADGSHPAQLQTSHQSNGTPNKTTNQSPTNRKSCCFPFISLKILYTSSSVIFGTKTFYRCPKRYKLVLIKFDGKLTIIIFLVPSCTFSAACSTLFSISSIFSP